MSLLTLPQHSGVHVCAFQGITEEQMVFLPVKMVDETTAIKSADYLIIYGRQS